MKETPELSKGKAKACVEVNKKAAVSALERFPENFNLLGGLFDLMNIIFPIQHRHTVRDKENCCRWSEEGVAMAESDITTCIVLQCSSRGRVVLANHFSMAGQYFG